MLVKKHRRDLSNPEPHLHCWPQDLLLARSRGGIWSMGSRILLAPGFASGKEQRRYMFDGFMDTAGPEICFLQRAEAVYNRWIHRYCWAWDLLGATSRGCIWLIGSWILLPLRLAFRKEQKRYIIEGFTDSAGPGICLWQGAEGVYVWWVHGHC